MLKRYQRSLARTFFLLDLLIVLSAFIAAACVRFGAEGRHLLLFPLEFKVFFVAYLVSWIFLANYWQLYASKRLTSFGHEALDVSKVTFLCTVFATIPAFFFREMPLSRLFLVYVWVLQTGSLIFLRFLVRRFLRYIRRQGYNFRQVLADTCARRFALRAKTTAAFGRWTRMKDASMPVACIVIDRQYSPQDHVAAQTGHETLPLCDGREPSAHGPRYPCPYEFDYVIL